MLLWELDTGDGQLKVYYVGKDGSKKFYRLAASEERAAFDAGVKYGERKVRNLFGKETRCPIKSLACQSK